MGFLKNKELEYAQSHMNGFKHLDNNKEVKLCL
jgi:hypothetical protein